jgi:transmembrane sensor
LEQLEVNVAEQIEERAALWLLRREESDWTPDEEAEFQAWLNESDANKVSYWRLEQGWRAADRIGALGLTARPATDRHTEDRNRGRISVAIAASVFLAFGAFVLQTTDLPFQSAPATRIESFEAGVGVRKQINLSDGSQIELNTATSLRAELGTRRRAVWLDRGEAFFEIAKRDNSPFTVYAGSRTIRVIGTKFGVRRTGDKVIVSVAEGRVQVTDSRAGASISSAMIEAGDVAIATSQSTLIETNTKGDLEERLAWRQDLLVFDDATLAEAAAEFNRYNHTELVIADPGLAQMRIGGRFKATNVEAFARLLKNAYGLEVDAKHEKIFISA